MAFKYKVATRTNSKILVGLYGQSGGGKSYGALLLARGIIGPKGKLGMLDSEGGRGELFADVPEIGGYSYAEIDEPFTPAKYIEGIAQAEADKLDALVIDSASHEWEGIGGVVHMAEVNKKASGKDGLHNWAMPKKEHQRFLLKILGARLHIIVCLRGKRKTHMGTKVVNGREKTDVFKDNFYSPKTDEDFVSEMLAFAEILGKDDPRGAKHSLIVGKSTHPAVATFFKTGEMITLDMGRKFAEWSAGKIKAPDSKAMAEQRERERTLYDESQAAAARAETTAGGGAPDESEEEWAPADGWPEFKKVSDWGKWSVDVLKTYDRNQAAAWRAWWSGFYDSLEGLVSDGKAGAKDMRDKINVAAAAAFKREPTK